jgi:hypothetical protein
MAPPTLFLGTKTSVAPTTGDINFTTAVLSSKGSTLITVADVSAIVQRIDNDISFIRENTDPAALDSLTEIVQRAANIDASLNSEVTARMNADDAIGARIDDEMSDRASAVTAEETARIAADDALGARIDDEMSDRASAVTAEETARVAADNALGGRIDDEISDRTDAVTAEETARVAADNALGGRIDDEANARVLADENARAIAVRSTRIMPMDVTVFGTAEKPTPKELVTRPAMLATIAGQTILNYDGWYFRNNSAGKKLHWYLAPNPGTTFGQIKAFMVDNLVIKKGSTIYITVYTARTGSNTPYPAAATSEDTWFKSRMTYVVANPNLVTESLPYRFLAKLDANAPNAPSSHTTIPLILSGSSLYTDANGDSVNQESDPIYAFAISSNSAASVGQVETIVSNFGYQTVDGLHLNLFSNDSVSAKFYAEKMSALYTYFFNKNILGADSAFLPLNV